MLPKLILTIAALTLVEASVSVHDPFYCFATDPIHPQNQMFSILTAYEAVRGTEIPNVSTCTPRKFWTVGRYGARLPFLDDITRMTEIGEGLQVNVVRNYDLGRTSLCSNDHRNIVEWIFNDTMINPSRSGEMVETGWQEVRGIAQRMQAAFPNILPPVYNRSQFLFRHADTDRARDGLYAFAEGLFGEGGYRDIVPEPIPNVDRLLSPHNNCPLYDSVRNNFVEQEGFEEGPDFQQMLEQVNRKLGFFGSNQMSSRDIRTVWDFCRFYQGWDPTTPSPWCAAFSIANNAVIEYFQDLYYFYNRGYGGDERLFSNMNCHLMQDLLQFLNSNNPNDHLARIYTTYTDVLQLFLVTLGVFRDEVHLTRHNFAQQTFRQWRTSVIAPMATSFVIVQHECAGSDNELLILYNERPLHIPGCEGNGFCRQSTFLGIFERFLNANCGELFCSRN